MPGIRVQQFTDPRLIATIHRVAGSSSDSQQGTKGWKLEALSDQFLNRHIDNVGQIVASPRGLQAGLYDYLPGSWAVRCNAEKSWISVVCRSLAVLASYACSCSGESLKAARRNTWR